MTLPPDPPDGPDQFDLPGFPGLSDLSDLPEQTLELHPSARKHFRRDRLNDAAVKYAS